MIRMMAPARRELLLFLLPALGILLVDQLSKFLVRTNLQLGESLPREGLLRLTYITNAGGVFGLFVNPSFLLVLTVIVGIVILFLYLHYLPSGSRLLQMGLGLVFGGAIGNLIDRLRFGEVTDFIDVRLWGNFHWPAFNLADSAITIGVFILAYCLLFTALRTKG